MKQREDKAYKQLQQVATAVHDTTLSAAVAAYDDARVNGLCHEGAWECALAAMRAACKEVLSERR